jgi:hypothetical protein
MPFITNSTDYSIKKNPDTLRDQTAELLNNETDERNNFNFEMWRQKKRHVLLKLAVIILLFIQLTEMQELLWTSRDYNWPLWG